MAIGLLVVLSEPQYLVWEIPTTLLPFLLMLPLRRVADSMGRQSALRHELALSRQREQVGRDVHDILGHSLTVMAVKADLASKLLDRDPERARAEMADVLALTRSSLGEVRATVAQIQAPELATQVAAARTALAAAGIRAEMTTRIPDLDRPQAQLFAWCIREAVTNVVRHSSATCCTMSITDTTLSVTDDGSGRGDAEESHGVRGMRDRVTEAGGSLVVADAQPGSARPGTRVEVTL